jgi:mannose-1-phosphate guanylyltransferase/mannose-1-phosphate guanylyltransferase/mannose-6-phosphate isomerase
MFDDCIIMAGGSGTRLWPASNSRTPKQFLSINKEGSFFNAAVERALAVTGGTGRVIIVAGKAHVPHVIRACEKYGAEEKKRLVLIPEPGAKNTAPAVVCGTLYAGLVSGEDRAALVLTSDHIIRPLEAFKVGADAVAVFARQGYLGVFGIPPRSPETGYGYIETGDRLAASESAVYRAVSFREKPDRDRAEQFLASGNFLWNSGMFGFSTRFMTEEFRRNAREIIGPFETLTAPPDKAYRMDRGLRILDGWPGLEEAYKAAPGISFDYAIAEKCTRTVAVTAGFEWFDVGSWDEYARLVTDLRSGTEGAEVYTQDAAGCFVDSDIPVALCGVEDLIVAVRSGKDGGPASVLISRKGATQGVKGIVEKIKSAGRTELL